MTVPHPFRLATIGFLVLGLAGCGGGTGPGSLSAAGTIDEEGRDALYEKYSTLEQRYRMWKPMGGHAVRDSGSATFNGVVAIRPEGGFTGDGGAAVTGMPDLIADMAMNIDFATNAVTGAMWDFHDSTGAQAGGSVQLSGEQDGDRIAAEGSGTLDWGDHHQDLDVSMGGVILAGEEALRGTMSIVSTIGTEETAMDGQAILINDTKSGL